MDLLELSRMSGDGVVRFDNSGSIRVSALREEIEIRGVVVWGSVNEQGLYYEDQGYGVPVETQRLTVDVSVEDGQGVEIGEFVTLRGDTYQIADRQWTGTGKVRLVL